MLFVLAVRRGFAVGPDGDWFIAQGLEAEPTIKGLAVARRAYCKVVSHRENLQESLNIRVLGHPGIEEQNVRLQLAHQLHSFGAVRGFTDDLMARLRLEQTPQAIADYRVIVSERQPNLLLWLSKVHAASSRFAALLFTENTLRRILPTSEVFEDGRLKPDVEVPDFDPFYRKPSLSAERFCNEPIPKAA